MLRSLVVASFLAAMAVNGQAVGQPRPAVFNTNAPQTGAQLGGFGLQQQPILGNFGTGMQVLPQNFQQQTAGQIMQPILTPQQAMQLIPTDMLQQALNQRVAGFAQMGGVQQMQMPIQQQIPIQQLQPQVGIQQPMQGFGGLQQQQMPMQFGGGIPQQQMVQQPIMQQPQFGGVGQGMMQQPILPQPMGPM